MSIKVKIYPFAISGNGSQTILAGGNFVRVLSCTGNVSLSLDNVGPVGPFTAGQGLKNVEFSRVLVTDASGAANAGTIVVADAEFVDQTLVGTVSVIDGSKARAIAGNAFMRLTSPVAVAAQSPYAQLLNPVGSGRNLVLESIYVSDSLAGYFNMRRYDTALATLEGSGISKSTATGTSVAEVRKTNSGAVLGGNSLLGSYWPTNGQFSYTFKEPLYLVPGTGIVIQGANANGMSAAFEWFEE